MIHSAHDGAGPPKEDCEIAFWHQWHGDGGSSKAAEKKNTPFPGTQMEVN